jgi:hypothetical protein
MNAKAALGIVGVIVAIVGIIGLFGFVPGLSVATSANGVATFDYTASGLTVTVTDHSSLPAPFGVTSCPHSDVTITCGGQKTTFVRQTLAWGDGTPALSETPGFQIAHTYAHSGSYNIVDNFTYTACPTLSYCSTFITATAVGPVTVPSNTTTGSSSVAPSFKDAPNGLSLTVTDISTATNAQIIGVCFNFGVNGTAVRCGFPGSSQTFLYGAAGTYNVSEAVTWTAANANGTALTRIGCPLNVCGASHVTTIYKLIAISSSGTSGVTVSATIATSGLGTWVNDTSTYTGSVTIQGAQVKWGDGTASSTVTTLGAHITHSYSIPGTYPISYVVTWSAQGTVGFTNSYVNHTVTVPSNGSGNNGCTAFCSNGGGSGGNGCTGTACTTASAFQINAGTVGLIFGGASLAIFALIPGPPAWRVLGFVLVTIAGAVVGYVAGGLPPL